MDDSSDSAPASPGTVLLGGNARVDAQNEVESSADEETSIVRRGSMRDMNYQTTARSTISRPSTTSIRRRGMTYEPGNHENDEG
jgi:hypothetical protein